MSDDAVHVERLRAICMVLPEATEVETFGNPTFRVATKPFAVFERYQGAPVVTVKASLDDQAALVDREGFEVAAYVGHHGWTNVRLDLDVPWSEIDELVVESYRIQAPKRLRLALDELLEAAGEAPLEADEEEVDLEVPAVPEDRRVVRLVEVATDDLAAVHAAEHEWRVATEGRRARSRVLFGRADGAVVLSIEYASAADAATDDELAETAELLDALARIAGSPAQLRTIEIDRTDRR
jgi:predicted DNA-binding protein (MmcQ/YjbR family)